MSNRNGRHRLRSLPFCVWSVGVSVSHKEVWRYIYQVPWRNYIVTTLEWVADPEIEYSVRIFEFVDPAVALRFARIVESDAPV